MRLSVKHQMELLLAATGAVLVVIALTVIIPSIRHIRDLKRDIDQTQLYLEKQYQRSQKLRRSTHEIDEVESAVLKYKNATIRQGEELSLITELERLAALYRIDQTLTVTFIDPKTDKKPHYTFSFLNHGSYSDHLRYLRALEDLPYYMIMNSLQWEKRQLRITGQSPITLHFNAEVYVTE